MILFVTGSLRFRLLRSGRGSNVLLPGLSRSARGGRCRVLQMKPDLLFPKCICHLRCSSKKVEVPSDGSLFNFPAAAAAAAKRVVVEGVLFVIELVT